MTDAPTIRLAPGQSLRGVDEDTIITVAADNDALQLSSDNRIHNIRLETSPEKHAILNNTTVESLGHSGLADDGLDKPAFRADT